MPCSSPRYTLALSLKFQLVLTWDMVDESISPLQTHFGSVSGFRLSLYHATPAERWSLFPDDASGEAPSSLIMNRACFQVPARLSLKNQEHAVRLGTGKLLGLPSGDDQRRMQERVSTLDTSSPGSYTYVRQLLYAATRGACLRLWFAGT